MSSTELAVAIGGFSILGISLILLVVVLATGRHRPADIAQTPTEPFPAASSPPPLSSSSPGKMVAEDESPLQAAMREQEQYRQAQPRPGYQAPATSQQGYEYHVRWRGRRIPASVFGVAAVAVGGISLLYAGFAAHANSSKRVGETIFGVVAVGFGLVCLLNPGLLAG